MSKKFLSMVLFLFSVATPALAQDYQYGYAPPPAPAVDSASAWSVEDLDDLVAPIALYPDPLLAQILPATTEPEQIALCAQYLRAGRSLEEIDAQPWDDSVKALARYPDILYWLDGQPDWVREVGDAFADDPDEVMNSVQQMRARAMAAGNLVSTPEEEITMDGGMILIMPADPEVICVPIYEPEVVYMPRLPTFVGPVIRFGPRFRRGVWERHEIDWRQRSVWTNRDGWRRGVDLHVDVHAQVWHPRVNRTDYSRRAIEARTPGFHRNDNAPRPQPARPEYRGYPPQPRQPVARPAPFERPREEHPVTPPHEEHRVNPPPHEEHHVNPPPHEEHPVTPPHEEHHVNPPHEEHPAPQPRVAPTPRGPIGAIDRGTTARQNANRGQTSRQPAQPRPAPAPAPAPHPAPAAPPHPAPAPRTFHPAPATDTRASSARGGQSRRTN